MKPMRSPFADRHEDVVPRDLRDLRDLPATEPAAGPRDDGERRRRRRRREVMTVRRAAP
ncbi:hypothetical protein GCM10010182_10510 [Actinomadura cremea]|nr:hypothetical protein GCM10010182_10510 [Actinomadura cremea]